MPFAVKCSSCQVSLKASEQHIGKSVKCPKCGKPVLISAPAAPARVPAAPAAPKLPLLSFEELNVPPRLRRSIEKEVNGENIVWMGRPTPEALLSKANIGMWVGLVLCVLVVGGTIAGYTSIADKLIGWVILGVGGLCFLTLALPLATMPIWVRKLLRYRDCYVLTATRAIVFDNEKILWATPRPFTADELGERELTVDARGNGNITFMDEDINLGLRTKRKERMQNTADGGKLRVITTTTYTEKAKKAVGFLDIANVEAVDALLRQLLKLGPPAKKNVAG